MSTQVVSRHVSGVNVHGHVKQTLLKMQQDEIPMMNSNESVEEKIEDKKINIELEDQRTENVKLDICWLSVC